MARDPYADAARRIVKSMGEPAIFTRASTSERIHTYVVPDFDVEVVDELGNVVDRSDMLSLLNADVGVPKSKDVVELTNRGSSFTLGRTIKDDGYVAKLMAQKNG